MGLKKFLSHKIKVEDLQPGDHIYTWRGFFYAHHGIYVGDGQVIHFGTVSQAEAVEAGLFDRMVEKAKQKMFQASICSNSGTSTKCKKCNINDKSKEMSRNCVECFLRGGDLYCYEYGVNLFHQQLRRAGTCTAEVASEVDKILHRAEYLLNHKTGFGKYDVLKRNCEDFALYCSVGIVGVGQGASGQAAPLKKTMARVKEIEVEDLVIELQAAESTN